MKKYSEIWTYYNKISNEEIQCKYCNKIYKRNRISLHLKKHLLTHGITFYVMEHLKNRQNNTYMWQYYTLEENCNAKCIICNELIRNIENNKLKSHIIIQHQEEITKIQKTITDVWLSQHFAFDVIKRQESHKTRCIHCNLKLDIFEGIDSLANHLEIFHNINESSRVENTKIQNNMQNISSQNFLWAWKHFTQLSGNTIKCNYCDKIYKSSYITVHLKIHLCNVHKIINDDDWKTYTNTSLTWQYYIKETGYTARCKICYKLLKHAHHVKNLQLHLFRMHKEKIIEIQEMIKCTWVKQYFAFNECDDKAKCICCEHKLTIFTGTRGLENHLKIFHGINENSRSDERNEGNNAYLMAQQSANNKNAVSTSSHGAGSYSQITENEGEQQRFYSGTVQDEQLLTMNSLKPTSQTDSMSNDDIFEDALHEIDTEIERIIENTEIGEQSVNEHINASTSFYQICTESQTTEYERNQWFYSETVQDDQLLTVNTSNTLQTDTTSNYDIFDTDARHNTNNYLTNADINGISEGIMMDKRIQRLIDELNANASHQTGAESQTAEYEGNQC
ncbi:hypothetical protein P5V15_012361 [Pogonomyrmex californicus]